MADLTKYTRVINVPKDKCPIDIIMELKEEALDMVFIADEGCISKMMFDSDGVDKIGGGPKTIWIHWKEKEGVVETDAVFLQISEDDNDKKYLLMQLKAADIVYKGISTECDKVCFLKMCI